MEVCFNETWGTVCGGIGSNIYSWNHSEANIVCKQLGYFRAGEIVYTIIVNF